MTKQTPFLWRGPASLARRIPVMGVAAATLLTALLAAAPVGRAADPGDLDTSFGTGGIVTTNFDGGNGAYATALQPDGKIVVAGYNYNSIVIGTDFALARFDPDGSQDINFGAGGLVTTDFNSGSNDIARAVALQPDGKIVVAGYSDSGSDSDLALARYNPNGDLDTTFGIGGLVITDLGTHDEAWDTAVQPDGKIVVGGYSGDDSALVRYNADGSLDTTFGTDGLVTADFGDEDWVHAIVIQADNQIVAAGMSDGDFALARFNPDGSLDTTFGISGLVTTDFGFSDAVQDITIQSDGKIVAAGSSNNSPAADFALARYHPDGSLDTTFGTGGTVKTDLGPCDEAWGIALQPDDQIIVAGWSYDGSQIDFAVVRYDMDGSLDPAFGAGGIVITDYGGFDYGFAATLQADDRIIVVGGTETEVDGYSDVDIAMARYNADGSPDPTFGTGGLVITNLGSRWDSAQAVALQSDGKIVVAGFSAGDSQPDFAVARYNPDGSLDPTFGAGGLVITDINPGYSDIAYDLALQTDGRIIVAGFSNDRGDVDFALVRYNTDGSLDPTFGTGGTVITDLGGHMDVVEAVAVQPDGKIVVAGGSDQDFALARYNPDGSLDTGFGTGGMVITDFGPSSHNGAYALVLQPDGKLVAAGLSDSADPTGSDFALARYNPDGSLDTTFGTDGTLTTDFGFIDEAFGAALQSDGKIVVAGISIDPYSVDDLADLALARYNEDGSLDTGFGTGGLVTNCELQRLL